MTPDNVKPLQRFYKGVLLVEIHKELNRHDKFTKKEIENVLKEAANVWELSTTKFTYDQIYGLVDVAKESALNWGLDFDDPRLDLDFNRTDIIMKSTEQVQSKIREFRSKIHDYENNLKEDGLNEDREFELWQLITERQEQIALLTWVLK